MAFIHNSCLELKIISRDILMKSVTILATDTTVPNNQLHMQGKNIFMKLFTILNGRTSAF